jgi:soluble lytic murein transglycosylase
MDVKRSNYYEGIIKEKFPLSYSNLTINKGKIICGPDTEDISILTTSSQTIVKKIDYLLMFDLSDDARDSDYGSVPQNDKKIINEIFRKYYESREYYYEAINFATKNAFMDYGYNLANVNISTLKKMFPFYYKELVEKHSAEYSVEKALCYAVIREESYFNRNARSWANAVGLMQIMPSTGDFIAGKIGIKEFDLKKPEDNIRMGIYYLGTLIKYFDSYQFAIAGYNGGQKRINQYKSAYKNFPVDIMYELIPNDETRHYIRKVMRSYYIYKFLLSTEEK